MSGTRTCTPPNYHYWPSGRVEGAHCQCGSDWYETMLVEKLIRRTTDPRNSIDANMDYGVVHPMSRAAASEPREQEKDV